ncbi:hypothetical protein CJ030_MR6G020517 [Morella rubra]|uniref:Uncharacterized protein n=1 Tax=Morella rubra TaxID=262757 RepID=A0A6A1VEQ6_9ROSI|nr:hypothetical protein CJ030_MR6G020517 [Morella rubra]
MEESEGVKRVEGLVQAVETAAVTNSLKSRWERIERRRDAWEKNARSCGSLDGAGVGVGEFEGVKICSSASMLFALEKHSLAKVKISARANVNRREVS